ncbi:AraC family transcriptional regulator [Brevundimonas sp. M20]|uniref:AraC family transcriptional regulator n=1 Tax=Brevundimonas sp. M20 TaxID=2591463 RepID=UPI0011477428|nr:AraC family transcriptional regulator [Brevundimonas sp. M20]QDH73487.1 AraC family transcriptional regulator [Brevundimonas sp. M20]
MKLNLGDRISGVLDAQFIGDGHYMTPVPGLILMRSCSQMPPQQMLYRPTLCIIAQGSKEIMVGDRTVRYGQGQTLVVTVEAPVLSRVIEASAASPYIGAILELDAGIIRDVATRLGDLETTGPSGFGLTVQDLDAQITGSLQRLLDLIGEPNAVDILYPSIMREIAYWLLRSPAGRAVARMVIPDGQPHRIAQAMSHLRDHFDSPVDVKALARSVGMSPSSFHQHFKALTAMSPLQYQKHIRLLEARRRMVSDGDQASTAAVAVGYESVSQFTREYARMFGSPPRRETRRARMARVRPEGSAASPEGANAAF